VAASYSVELDVVPGSNPFIATAFTGSNSLVITVDPAAKIWTLRAVVPTSQTRAWNFSGVSQTVFDFSSTRVVNGAAVIDAFPGNVIPFSRADPLAATALAQIPFANTVGSAGSPNTSYTSSGPIPDNGHLKLTGAFGGFQLYDKALFGQSVAFTSSMLVDLVPQPSQSSTVKFQ
jgi:hypothetical protein